MSETDVFDEKILDDVEEQPAAYGESRSDIVPSTPKVGTPEWTDWLLAQLTEEEKENGNPNVDGLRRLVEDFVGMISTREIIFVESPKTPNGVATVQVRVIIPHVANVQHPCYMNSIVEDDIADCGIHNTEQQYAKHASSTAATRAEARALRKILRLRRILAAEELVTPDSEFITQAWNPGDKIDDTQAVIIETICRRCDIDVLSFINAGEKQYGDISEVSKSTATTMIQVLTDVQRGQRQKPVSVGPFNPNWRSEK